MPQVIESELLGGHSSNSESEPWHWSQIPFSLFAHPLRWEVVRTLWGDLWGVCLGRVSSHELAFGFQPLHCGSFLTKTLWKWEVSSVMKAQISPTTLFLFLYSWFRMFQVYNNEYIYIYHIYIHPVYSMSTLSCSIFATPWTVAPLSMEFSRY